MNNIFRWLLLLLAVFQPIIQPAFAVGHKDPPAGGFNPYLSLSGNMARRVVTIEGPACVLPGFPVSYYSGGTYITDNSQWCVNGGGIQGSTSSCKSGTPVQSIVVTYSTDPGSTQISLTVNGGSYTTLSPVVLSTDQINISGPQVIVQGTSAATLTPVAVAPECGFTYQWQQRLSGGSWTNISGATSATYNPGAITETTEYRRSVSANGNTLLSNEISIQVTAALDAGGITSPVSSPIAYNTAPGTISSFEEASGGTGSGYVYQWQKSSNGSTWTDISGASATSYTPGALTATTYFRRKVTRGAEAKYSNSILITVNAQLVLSNISNPVSAPINHGVNPGTINGTTPTGGGCSGVYSYQWQSSVNGSSFTNIASATALNYNPGSMTASRSYRLAVTCGSETKTTNAIYIQVYAPVNPGTINGSQTIDYNTTPSQLTGSVAAGGDGTVSVQWQSSTDNISYNNIVGATGNNYSPSALTVTTYYRRVATSDGVSANSNVLTVTVNGAVTSGGNVTPSAKTVNYNTSPGQLSCTLPTGGGPIYAYQWQESGNGSIWTDVSGATSQHYTPGNLTTKKYYRRQATTNGNTSYSDVSVISVYAQLLAGSITPPGPLTLPFNSVVPTLSANPSGGTGSYSYQWQTSPNNTTWTDYPGFAGEDLDYDTGLTATTYFRVKVTSNGVTATSGGIQVTVQAKLNGGNVSPLNPKINYNTAPGTLTVSPSGGSGSYTYQWQFSTDNSYWQDAGSTTSSHTPGNLTQSTYLRCVVTSGSVTTYSQTTFVTVYGPLTAGTVYPASQTVMPNTAATPVTANPPAGGSGSYTTIWQKSTNGTTYTDISGSTASIIDPGELNANTWYRQKITSNGITIYTGNASVQVQLNGGLISASASSVNPGGTITLSNTTSPSNGSCGGSYTTVWQKSANEIDWTDFPSATVSNIMAPTYYRRKVTCGTEISYSNTVIVRVDNGTSSTPDTVTMISTTQPNASIPAYGTGASATNMNFTRSRTITKPGVTTEAAAAALTNFLDVQQQTEYVDGLGRPLQTVTKQATPNGKDVVSLNVYDAYDREPLKFKTYGASTSDGNFKLDPASAQPAFYNTLFGGKESHYYNRDIYDNAPDGDVLESRQAGKSYEGNARGKRMLIRTNRASEGVRIWKVGYNETDIPTSTTAYAAGSLMVTEATDESNNKVITYKDKQGRTILVKKQNNDQISEDHNDWLCTYYIYDEIDQLRCIITPKAVNGIKATWVLDSTTHAELCFSSYYDDNGNKIVNRVPGGNVTENIYDHRERAIFVRDNYQKSKSKWVVNAFDDLNRPLIKGTYINSAARTSLQTTVDNNTVTVWTITNTFQDIDLFLEQHTGKTLYQATSSITWLPGFNSNTDALVAEISPSAPSDTIALQVNNFVNGLTGAALRPDIYYFYDDYNFTDAQPAVASDLPKALALSNTNADVYTTFNPINTSLQTGMRVRVLGTEQWLTTTTYYNPRQKVSQIVEQNISGIASVTSMLYNFGGTLLSKYVFHKNASANQYLPVLYLYHLNAAGKVDSVKVRLNNNAATQQTIAYSAYDELGQLSQKKLGVTGSSTQLETLNFSYTLKGDVTGINEAFVNTPGSTANWFGLVNAYDKGFSKKSFNGLLAGTKWKSRGDGIARAMAYQYDNSDRLTTSSFAQQNEGGTVWQNNLVDFSSSFRYDENGNTLSVVQKGLDGPIIKTIDSLEYGYFTKSNKLNYVKDYRNEVGSKRGDFNETVNDTSQDYWYDVNNNVIRDKNKGIDSVRNNELNLAEYISVPGKGTMTFVYRANGMRLRKTTNDLSVTPAKVTVTDYIDAFTYVNDTLQQFTHDEGRVRQLYKNGQAQFTFDYFARDPLGNNRMVLGTSTDTSRYMATMENQYSATENLLFSNIDNTRSAKPSGYPADATTNPNSSVAKLNAQNGQKIGPSIVLRVMAGDTIQAGVKAFYKSGGSTAYTAPVTDMLTSLLSSFGSNGVVDGVHKGSGANSPITSMTSGLYSQVKNNDPTQNQPDRPKAYLTYAAFDDQFNLVNENSAVRQVQTSPDELQTLATGEIVIKKTGFIYIYVNNENGQDVYFDNLSVVHNSGPLLEETHYYPYGLTMAGISSRALKGDDYYINRKKYNGIEFNEDLDINEYEAQFRTLDPQTGRWMQIDPKTEEMESWSPYASNYCNPVKFNDFLGDEPGGPGTDDEGDQSGIFTNATSDTWRRNPWGAMLQEIGYATATVTGLNNLEEFIINRFNPKNNGPVQIVKEAAIVTIGLSGGKAGRGLVGEGGIAPKVAPEGAGISTPKAAPKASPKATSLDGSFSITELGWKDYPANGNVPKPTGPFRLLKGQEYSNARKAANAQNAKIHRADPSLKGKEVHEIHPVKFGGSPTANVNKVPLAPSVHRSFTNWWKTVQKNVQKNQ